MPHQVWLPQKNGHEIVSGLIADSSPHVRNKAEFRNANFVTTFLSK